MKEIFESEENIVSMAKKLLEEHIFSSVEDEKQYRILYEEYKRLLRQMMRVVKLSDLMQRELKMMSEKLEIASQIDDLTGVYNRRYFNKAYQIEWRKTVRSNHELALIMIDIDHFKKYNDTYGHLQGDKCLKAVATEIKNSVNRSRDIVSRFGGEEFLLLLPETGIDGAAFIAQKVLSNIEHLSIKNMGSDLHKQVTVSIGVTAATPKEEFSEELTMDRLLKQVDHALYVAKEEGRNCFRVYESTFRTD